MQLTFVEILQKTLVDFSLLLEIHGNYTITGQGKTPMVKDKLPVTQAIRVLKKSGTGYTLYPYRYEENGGTGEAARELNIDEHQVIKAQVMENERRDTVFHFPCVNDIPRSSALIFASNISGLVNFSS